MMELMVQQTQSVLYSHNLMVIVVDQDLLLVFGSTYGSTSRTSIYINRRLHTPAMSFDHQDNAGTNSDAEKEVVEAVNTADVVGTSTTSIISKSKGDGSERTITVGNQTTETNDTLNEKYSS